MQKTQNLTKMANGHIHNFLNKMVKAINFWFMASDRILIKINTKNINWISLIRSEIC